MGEQVNKNIAEKQFKDVCKPIEIGWEYPGFTGTEKWIIVSDLTETEIEKQYPEEIKPFKPYALVGTGFNIARDEYRRNENQSYYMKTNFFECLSIDDEALSSYHSELRCVDENLNAEEKTEEVKKKEQMLSLLEEGLTKLTPAQLRRIKAVYFEGKSSREIARGEKVNHSAVVQSLTFALKKLNKFISDRIVNQKENCNSDIQENADATTFSPKKDTKCCINLKNEIV